MPHLNTSHEKMSDFVLFPLFRFTLVIKLRNFDFESHWNTLIYFDKKRYAVRFKYVPWKDVWFCFISFPLFRFTLVIKLKKFGFKGHLNTLIFFDRRRCQIWLCPVKQCLIWFKLRYLSRILAINWEIRILDFIRIV